MATNVQTKRGAASSIQSDRNRRGGEPKATQAAQISPGLRVIITIAVIMATLMEVLDTSIVNVAIPTMEGNLGATLDDIGWVSTGYIISNVIVLPLTGWFSDYFGRKYYLAGSIVVFTVASFGCGISTSLFELVAFRVLQGAGGAAFLSTAQATLLEVYPPALQGVATGIFGIGVVMAPTLGPSIGGYITDNYSWPWIFFINIPIGILTFALTMIYIPNSGQAGKKRRLDVVGVGLLVVGLGSLQTVLERGETEDWLASNMILSLIVVSAVGLLTFVWWELRPANKSPVVNLRLFRNRNLMAGWIYTFVFGLILLGGIFIIPQFFQNVQTHTAEETGFLLIPGGLATAVMMPIVGILSNRVDARILIVTGAVVVILSQFQFSHTITITAPNEAFFWPLVLRGAGIGLQFVPLSLVALGTLKPQQVAEGAGLYNLSRQLGGSFGIAILTTFIDNRQHFHYARLDEYLNSGDPNTLQRLSGLQSALISRGLSPDQAMRGAYKVLGGTLTQQSFVQTYIDAFWFIAWVAISSLLLIFLFERPKHKVAAAE